MKMRLDLEPPAGAFPAERHAKLLTVAQGKRGEDRHLALFNAIPYRGDTSQTLRGNWEHHSGAMGLRLPHILLAPGEADVGLGPGTGE